MARARGHALTWRPNGLARVIETPCQVCAAYDPATTPQDQQAKFTHQFKAIWDTGASATVITNEVVKACGLVPTGMKQVHHAGGVSSQETYLVNVRLPNGVGFSMAEVTKAPLTGTHVLIGMDIISLGDFTITNKDGQTIFTFRIPSTARTDYVKEEERLEQGAAQSPGASFHGKKGKGGKKR